MTGVPMVEVESRWGQLERHATEASAGSQPTAPVLTVQWEPLADSDLQAVVGQFQLTYDPIARAAVLAPIADVAGETAGPMYAPEFPNEADSWVFLAMTALDGPADKLKTRA